MEAHLGNTPIVKFWNTPEMLLSKKEYPNLKYRRSTCQALFQTIVLLEFGKYPL